MFRDPTLGSGCSDPLRGDGESAFAQPKDTQIADSRQDTLPPLLLSAGILQSEAGYFRWAQGARIDSWQTALFIIRFMCRRNRNAFV
jgi:hypothetical protein